MIQFRDGPFVRPHPGECLPLPYVRQSALQPAAIPAFWRVVLGINLLYEGAMVFLLFQDVDSARSMMKFLDPSLGNPLPEKSYAENCDLTVQNVWVSTSRFPAPAEPLT